LNIAKNRGFSAAERSEAALLPRVLRNDLGEKKNKMATKNKMAATLSGPRNGPDQRFYTNFLRLSGLEMNLNDSSHAR
jgi:hypothetical protein